MKICTNCNVILKDPTPICPLCRCIAQENDLVMGFIPPEPGAADSATKEAYPADSSSARDAVESGKAVAIYPGNEEENPEYPYADRRRKRMVFVTRLYLFLSFFALATLTFFNVGLLHHKMWGTLLTACFLGYGYLTLKFTFQSDLSIPYRIMMQAIYIMGLVILLDLLFGFHKWSITYVCPAIIIAMLIFIFVMMLVDKANWQSYIPMELVLILLAAALVVAFEFKIVGNIYLCMGTLLLTIFLFLGTLMIGGRKARNELYRRFHI